MPKIYHYKIISQHLTVIYALEVVHASLWRTCALVVCSCPSFPLHVGGRLLRA